ncbi:hypothetical protein [Undibacterium sp. TS12]|uniref:hypothetical protein n=1 Tax=Undibacterium sp. TS12 TaxID=2908202 RepID=UPI001F4D1411|nr:hypothetical protein [Undibacterium sp. TS12]MCH8622338.1 hypothetical protein [Undibacterium sp. TS12]
MSIIFHGPLKVHFGQFYVLPTGSCGVELDDAFRGQANGLCGAAVPGSLFLITGLHTGEVEFTLEVLDAEPPIDDRWEEIVEVSLDVAELPVLLESWGGDVICETPVGKGCYRVRYCALAMDEGHESLGEDGIVDFYRLSVWPSPKTGDVVVKQTSQSARYWHETVRSF